MMGEGKLSGGVWGSSFNIPKQRGKLNSDTAYGCNSKEHLCMLPLRSPACILGHNFLSFGRFFWYFKGFKIIAYSVLVNTWTSCQQQAYMYCVCGYMVWVKSELVPQAIPVLVPTSSKVSH